MAVPAPRRCGPWPSENRFARTSVAWWKNALVGSIPLPVYSFGHPVGSASTNSDSRRAASGWSQMPRPAPPPSSTPSYGRTTPRNGDRKARAEGVSSRYVVFVDRQTASPVIVVAAITSVSPRKFGPPESP